jgi:predicted kinase
VVYLLVGLTGAGKTTYARRVLEPAGVVALSADEAGERLPEHLAAGRDVALDLGLLRRADRDHWKLRVEALGGRWRLLYFPVSRAELLHRLPVPESEVDDLYTRLEEPVDEGEEVVQPGSY